MQIPYDPDFDGPRRVSGFFSGLKPQAAFLFGVVVGVLIVSIVGGFLLLVR